jgi:hypothetical protein
VIVLKHFIQIVNDKQLKIEKKLFCLINWKKKIQHGMIKSPTSIILVICDFMCGLQYLL